MLQEGYMLDKCKHKVWDTSTGKFTAMNEINFDWAIHPNLMTKWAFSISVSVKPKNNGSYDIIIGKDMTKHLGINIDIVSNTIHWDELSVPMVSWGCLTKLWIEACCFTHFHADKASIETSTPTKQVHFADSKPPLKVDEIYATTAPLRQAHYKPSNLNKIAGNITHLTTDKKNKLLTTLKTHKTIFEGHHGDWKREVVALWLKPDLNPYYARPYPIPLSQLCATKHEVYCQCDIRDMWQLMGKEAEENT